MKDAALVHVMHGARERLDQSRRFRFGPRRAGHLPREAAALETNLVPVILEAVKARATLGEIAGAMREIFGAYRARSEI